MSVIYGQSSLILATRSMRAAITRFGAMLGPVVFFADSDTPVAPYSVPHWATASDLSSVSPLLRALRGDFMCSAFGDNDTQFHGIAIPPHGDTANGEWEILQRMTTTLGTALRLKIELPTQGGCCIGTTVLLEGHQFFYQRHDFEGVSGAINPGHHVMLACPPAAGATLLSFSPTAFSASSPPRGALSSDMTRSQLIPGCFVDSPTAMPTLNGGAADMTVFPHGEEVDDVFIVCSTPEPRFAWSAATFPGKGYAWLALRRRAHFPSTLVWHSNGGRLDFPWNGRHAPVLGIEDMIGYFVAGLSESSRPNSLTARGIPTCLEATPRIPLIVPYIQGLFRIPGDFGRVLKVEPSGPAELLIHGTGRMKIETPCRWQFLTEERIPGLCER
jgi:hypothetical protein